MRIARVLLITSAIIASLPAAAAAQPTRKVGLTIAFPESVGLLWHVNDRFALRPDFSFSFTSTEIDDDDTGVDLDLSSDSHQITYGVSALIYVAQWDALRAYVTPRVAFVNGHAETTVVASREVDLSGYEFSGSFGAQYGLGDRFAVFGELGLDYSSVTSEVEGGIGGVSLPDTKTSRGGLRSGVGLVFYF